MLKFIMNFIYAFILAAALTLPASALCEHNFSCEENKRNLIYNNDRTHSYYCLEDCGSYGTVKDGVGGKEKCSFSLASECSATCTQDGIRVYMCTVCYNRFEEKIPVKKHRYVKTRRIPTCTQSGYDIYTCADCGKYYTDNAVKPMAHISDGRVIEIMPFYGKSGIIKESCRVCGSLIGRVSLNSLIDEKSNYTPAPVSGFKVKSSDSSAVKLTWKKSEYALYYKLYYSADKKKWKALTSEKTDITVKGLKPSSKYYFKIKAVGDGVTGAESKVISAFTSPGRSSFISVVSAGKSEAAVKWKKQSNVSGYELSYSPYSFSRQKSIKKVNVTKSVKKTVKKLKSGKKYYFRIRAYKIIAKKKIYGAFSKTVTVKIK